nr:hypothetical protein [Tanacetum cinerariifolium]
GNSQNNFNDKGYWDSGCSRHVTCKISHLSDFEPFDGGYVSFGQGGCKITGKGTIKTGKLKFENVYFMKDLKYNLFIVSQICDNKNSVLFTDSECIVLGRNFKLSDDDNVLLRTPRQHNMYSIDLNNTVPHEDLTCLVAKASADKCMLWHRRLVTDDFSRFTWTFFLKTKDETSGILRKFITKIENVKDLKVKIIRCDNGGEFRNKEMNDFCSQKRNKREFSNARTPQQNGVVERRNRTLIEAARTMLADVKLPVTFWAEAVNTACYVQNKAEAVNTACYFQNRVLVNKSQNKTPYELFNGRTPAIGFLKPFGCHVMILNTLDNLGKFEAKGDEGYFIGYSMSSKAFRVFNMKTRRVEENLHVEFLENKAIDKGDGPNWLFDIDSLTKSMNYVPVDAGTNSTKFLGTKDAANQEVKKDVSSLRYILLPNWAYDALLESSSSKSHDESITKVPEGSGNPNPTVSSTNPPADQIIVKSPIPTVSSPVPTAYLNDSPEPSSEARLDSKRVANQEETPSLDNILSLANRFEDILGVTISLDEAIRVEADISNMETTILASPTPTLRIHKDHPKSQIIGPVLKNKKDERGIVVRNKARLVAQGNIQEEGIDYDEVFAPVARIAAIRLFLAYASFMGFTVYQMDVNSAFLYGTIDEEVYVMKPPGFQDLEFPAKVYKLEKAMYGLHQAPRAWYGTLSKYLLKNGFQRDSDYGGASQDRKSTTGGSQFLGKREISVLSCKYWNGTSKYWGVLRILMIGLRLIPLKKGEFNTNFHPMVDFIAASPLRYALTIKPTIFVSHIRQFWSTARIETTDKGTYILATVDGIQRTIFESSLRRNLKLRDEDGIVSIPDTVLFENLTLMGYNISQNQNLTFQKGQLSYQWKYLIHTIMQCLSPKSIGFNEFSSNIATALVCLATNRTYNFSKMIFDGMVKNVNNKISKFLMYP